MGGQSAFGTKAGDLFTRITIITAAIWVLLSMAALKVLNSRSATAGLSGQRGAPTVPSPGAGGIPLPEKSKTEGDQPADKSDSKEPPASGDADKGAAPATSTTPAADSPVPSTPAEPAKP
jgi:preprotein translocase subunit SecG